MALVSVAKEHGRITAAGALVAGISDDDLGRNAAMVAKLRLPFPLLADPGGGGAIRLYGVWQDEPSLARPALVLVAPDGQETFRRVSRDLADRLTEDDAIAALQALHLPPVAQPAPTPADPRPGERASASRACPSTSAACAPRRSPWAGAFPRRRPRARPGRRRRALPGRRQVLP